MAQGHPSEAQVVIIGGGIIGCSLAYHLTKLGWRDVVLLERRKLTSGTTWHAAGLVGQLRATANLTRLAQYTTGLYAGLEAETGQATGFKQNGSLSVASDAERFEELKRGASMARTFGLEVEVVTPQEARDFYPLLNIEDIIGGVILPNDGQTNPTDTTMALAKGARQGGAKILEEVKVTGILKAGGRVTGVTTEQGGAQGEIKAEVVVNCAGMWGREVGRMAGVAVPLQACEHFYIVTEEIADLPGNLPVMRDPGGCAYFKEDAGKLLLGAFEPNAKPWALDGIPADFEFDQLPEDFEHFEPILEQALHRVPILGTAGIRTFFNGPESFTPDTRYILGEAPELAGFFLACGFNSIGIQSAGGAGKVMAEWIVQGHPPMDLWDVDIRRLQPFQASRAYLAERATESLGKLYAMHWPYLQSETARGLRRSPLHQRLEAAGACFGEVAGWERPNWFAREGQEPVYGYSYGRQNWFDNAAEEHRAVREAVGLFDQSSFGKFLVQGADAEAALQKICANDVAVPEGKVVYTPWLNGRGGIEADLTLTRLAGDAYLVVTGAAVTRRDFTWLKSHLPSEARVTACDVTSAYAVLGLMGPRSRAVLSQLSGADLSNEAFPFGTSQEIEIGAALVRATRITYVGELGWELYVPAEFALYVFDRITAAGEGEGLRLAGLHVLDSCRIEKAYRHWGHDITDEETPLEAGLGFTCRYDKNPPFIGREALLRQKEEGLTRRLVQFALDDPEALIYHNEPIYRDGALVGHVTSAAYGHHLGRAIGLGYVEQPLGAGPDHVTGGNYEIEVACERIGAQASLKPLYDPRGERIRA